MASCVQREQYSRSVPLPMALSSCCCLCAVFAALLPLLVCVRISALVCSPQSANPTLGCSHTHKPLLCGVHTAHSNTRGFRRSYVTMHLGHDHHMKHQVAVTHDTAGTNKPKKWTWRVLLAALCFVFPVAKRRVSRLDVAVFVGCFTFLVAVDRMKSLFERAIVNMSELYQGWRAHRVSPSILYNKDNNAAGTYILTVTGNHSSLQNIVLSRLTTHESQIASQSWVCG
jgi:hypothetical protein